MVLLFNFLLIFALTETSLQEPLFVKLSKILVRSTTSYSLSVLNIDRSADCIDILEELYAFTTVHYSANLTVEVKDHPWSLKYFTPSSKVNIWCNYKVAQEFAVLRTVDAGNRTLTKPDVNELDKNTPTNNQNLPGDGQITIDIYRKFLNNYPSKSPVFEKGEDENSEGTTVIHINSTEDTSGVSFNTDSLDSDNHTLTSDSANETIIPSYVPTTQVICRTGPKRTTICRNNQVFTEPDAVDDEGKIPNFQNSSSIADVNQIDSGKGSSASSAVSTSRMIASVSNFVGKEFDHESSKFSDGKSNSNSEFGTRNVTRQQAQGNNTRYDRGGPINFESGRDEDKNETDVLWNINPSPNLNNINLRPTESQEKGENGENKERNKATRRRPNRNPKSTNSSGEEDNKSKNETSTSSKVNTNPNPNPNSNSNHNMNYTNPSLTESQEKRRSKGNPETTTGPKGNSKPVDSSRETKNTRKNETSSPQKTNPNLNYTNPRLVGSKNSTKNNSKRNETNDDTSEFDLQFIEKSAMGLNPRFYYILLVDAVSDALETHLRMLWRKYKIFRFIIIPKSPPEYVYYFSPYPECDVGGRLKLFTDRNLDLLPDVIEKTVWNLHKCKMGVVMYSRVPTAIPVDENNQFNDTEGSKFIGQDGMFMNTLIERMNFTPVMFTPRGVRMEYGIKKVKGKFTGTFYPILNGSAELCSNGHFVKDYRDKSVIDFVKPITLDYVSIMAPKASVIPPVITVLLSFELSVWLMLTFTFFATVSIYVLYLKYVLPRHIAGSYWSSSNRPVNRRKSENLWSSAGRISSQKQSKSPIDQWSMSKHSVRSLLNRFPKPRHSVPSQWSSSGRMNSNQHGWLSGDHPHQEHSPESFVQSEMSKTPRKTVWLSDGRSVEAPSGVDIPIVFFDTFRFFISSPPAKCLFVGTNFERILIASILVFTIVITSSFQGNLVRFLSVPVHYPDIDTLKQLQESRLLIWTSSLSWRDIFYSDPILWGLASKVHRWKSEQDMHDSDGNYAGFQRINVHSYKYFKDVILTGLKNNSTRKLHTLSQNLITYYLAYIVIKDSPYRTRIDTLISRMEAAGLPAKWSSDVIKYTLETYRTVEDQRTKRKKVFTLADVFAAFLVLGVGAVISAVTLFVEVVVDYYRYSYRFRKVIIPSKGSEANYNEVFEVGVKNEAKVPSKIEFCP